MAYSDALDREAAWLGTVDTLGDLTVLFPVLQARYPRTPAKSKRALYVTRTPGTSAEWDRFSNGRTHVHHHLRLVAEWPLTSGVGSAEADQLAFDQAIDVIVARVLGPLGDKTHGGRFLAAAEDPARPGLTVDADDPERAIPAGRFTARITYQTVDEITN